jgi:hypothetical protein
MIPDAAKEVECAFVVLSDVEHHQRWGGTPDLIEGVISGGHRHARKRCPYEHIDQHAPIDRIVTDDKNEPTYHAGTLRAKEPPWQPMRNIQGR